MDNPNWHAHQQLMGVGNVDLDSGKKQVMMEWMRKNFNAFGYGDFNDEDKLRFHFDVCKSVGQWISNDEECMKLFNELNMSYEPGSCASFNDEILLVSFVRYAAETICDYAAPYGSFGICCFQSDLDQDQWNESIRIVKKEYRK